MDYLQLRAYDDYINASIILAKLDGEGITCHLQDEHTVTMRPFLSNAVGGIKLMVLQDHFEQAVALLAEFDKDYRESITCPQCGSHNVEYINKPGIKNWITALFSWWISSYAVATEQVYHCFACKHEFKDLPEEGMEAGI